MLLNQNLASNRQTLNINSDPELNKNPSKETTMRSFSKFTNLNTNTETWVVQRKILRP